MVLPYIQLPRQKAQIPNMISSLSLKPHIQELPSLSTSPSMYFLHLCLSSQPLCQCPNLAVITFCLTMLLTSTHSNPLLHCCQSNLPNMQCYQLVTMMLLLTKLSIWNVLSPHLPVSKTFSVQLYTLWPSQDFIKISLQMSFFLL